MRANFYRTLYAVCICGFHAACGMPSPTGLTGAAELPSGGAGSTVAEANTLAPPSHDGNTIGQVSLTPASCPTPSSANDYFGQPRCCFTQAALCEDFESGSVGASPDSSVWTVNKATTDVVEISNLQSARGNRSLHIHVNNNGGQHAMIVNTSAFPFANNTFWGRAFVYWNSTTYTNNHTTYVAAGPAPNTNYEWMRYSSFGSGHLGGNDSDPDNSSGSSTSLPSMTWGCIEWLYDAPAMKAEYYLNGQLLTTLNIDAKHTSATGDLHWQQIEIGWELYAQDGSTPSWDMFFDEIALNATRIGCAN